MYLVAFVNLDIGNDHINLFNFVLFQAEEAQRLRKRKKAESMRLLDMQRRQKQRVEEVRETQKKV